MTNNKIVSCISRNDSLLMNQKKDENKNVQKAIQLFIQQQVHFCFIKLQQSAFRHMEIRKRIDWAVIERSGFKVWWSIWRNEMIIKGSE